MDLKRISMCGFVAGVQPESFAAKTDNSTFKRQTLQEYGHE